MVSSLEPLGLKLFQVSCTGFYVNVSFNFSWCVTAGLYGEYAFNLQDTDRLFSSMVPSYILVSIVLLVAHQPLYYFGFVFNFSHSSKPVMLSHCRLSLCFSNDSDAEHEVLFLYLNFSYNVHVFLFMCLLHLFFSLSKNHFRPFVAVVLTQSVPEPAAISITWKLTENTDFSDALKSN